MIQSYVAAERPEPVPATPTDGGRSIPAVVAIQHEQNRGAGAAVKTGYEHALRGGSDVVVTIDADGQMDTDSMDRLLDPIARGDADFAKGNRLTDAESYAEMPRFRAFGNWLLTALTKWSSGYWSIRDPQNGYTAISAGALQTIDIDAIPDRWGYLNDLLARLNAADICIADVSMPAQYGQEESTIDLDTYVVQTSWTLLRAFCWRLYRRYVCNVDRGTRVASLAGIATLCGGLALTTAGLLAETLPPAFVQRGLLTLVGATVLLGATAVTEWRDAGPRVISE
ncbi:glycosyltransferase family 2 protein [Haloarculaceae archaeon H-GB2-1]|nr:glycosyltransferase family 2 protein [Haloarculaceae archaeon H-GB2-1]